MSYMRGNYYVWHDGENVHIWSADGYDGWNDSVWAVDDKGKRDGDRISASGVSLPEPVLDQLVMMRLAQMMEENLVEGAIDRAIGNYKGNFGCDSLARNGEIIKAGLKQIKIETPDGKEEQSSGNK